MILGKNLFIATDVTSTGIPISEDLHIFEIKRELNLLNLSILFPNSKV